QRLLEGPPIDVVIETVGGEADTFMQALTVARRGGRVGVLGAFTAESPFNPSIIMVKELTVVGGLTYGRPDPYADFDFAVDIVSKHRETLGRLITHRIGLERIQEAFETAADKSRKTIKVSVEA
ncbi:MAG TPA: zinc-binding dehydrogenase, partial [Dehalococcoidia bacterium]|nr:zinc-binding dehydrogenase [Dehalococcoidia bacterium]